MTRGSDSVKGRCSQVFPSEDTAWSRPCADYPDEFPKRSPIAGSQCVFSSQSDTLYIVYFGNCLVFSFRDLHIKYIIAGGSVWTSFNFCLPVGRTCPCSRRQVCCKAVAAALCCPFRYVESLTAILTGYLIANFRNAECVIFTRNLLLICCNNLSLTDTGLEV